MATSGRINGTYAVSSYKPYLKWSVTQDTANNRSVMSVTFGMTKVSNNNQSYSNLNTALTLTVNGQRYTRQITFDYRNASYPTDHDIVTISGISINHEADGSKSVTLSASHETGISLATGSVNGTAELTTIPRASTMTVPETINMGTAYTFPIKTASSAFSHQISWQFAGVSGTLSGNVWTPPETLAQQIPNAESGAGILTLTTYNGSSTVGSNSYPFTLRCPESMAPTAALTQLSLVQDAAIPSGWNVAVKGFTALSYQVSASGVQGSSVSAVRFTCGGATASGTSGTTGALTAAGTYTPTVTVTDSRGRSVTVTGEPIEVYDYAPPALAVGEAYRCNAQGEASGEGVYLAVRAAGQTASSIGGRNTVSVGCRLRAAGGTFGAETTLADNTLTILHPPLAVHTSYEVELFARDALGGRKTVLYSIPTATVAFHLRRGGNGAAFGKYAERQNALEVSGTWDIRWGNRSLLEAIYPVGSVYLNVTDADPAALLGGTWQRLGETIPAGVYAWKRTA
ncbi:MAG: hypothetical protein J5482_02715 [Oscillospiraceae bacterium]|nr:hypothetical protein [Oscillospiraceae bacterium]